MLLRRLCVDQTRKQHAAWKIQKPLGVRGMASRQKVGDQPGLDGDIHAANRAPIDDVGATDEKIERPAFPHNKPNHPLPSPRIAG
jgi:hypothetical protein